MKKYQHSLLMTALILFLSIGFIFSCYSICSAKELKDKNWGYKVQYPSDWVAKTYPNSRDLVKADINKKDNSAGIQIRIYSNKSGNLKKFAKWKIDEFTKGMQGHWGGKIKIEKKVYTRIGKHNGYRVTYDLTRGDGQRLILKEYMFSAGKKVYVMQGGMPYKDRAKVEPILEGIARSFDFLK